MTDDADTCLTQTKSIFKHRIWLGKKVNIYIKIISDDYPLFTNTFLTCFPINSSVELPTSNLT